jgi:O-antigen/teichoic acid export membrane protein
MRAMPVQHAAREPNAGAPTGPGGEDANDRVLPQGAQTLGVKILAYAAGAVGAVVVARALGPRERGVWSLALLVASLLAQVADAGLSTSALFLVRSRPDRVRAVVSMSTGIVCVLSVALGLLVLSFKGLGLAGLLGMRFEVVAIVGLVVPILALLGLIRQLVTALGDLPGANASVLGQSLLLPAVLSAMLLTGPPVAAWALWGYLGVAGSALVFTGSRLWRRVPPGPLWDARLLGTLLRLGVPSQLGGFALSLTYRSDLFLVGHWLGLGGAGIYSIGLTLSEMLRGVPETAQALVVSRAVKANLPSYAGEVARVTVLVTVAAGLSLAVAAPVVVPIVFGEVYSGAAVVLACLVPGVVGLAVSYAISPLLFLEGRIAVSAVGALAALAVLWAASLCTPFEVSLPKVALASSLAYWTLAGIQLAYLVSRGRIELRAVLPGANEIAHLVGILGRRRRG